MKEEGKLLAHEKYIKSKREWIGRRLHRDRQTRDLLEDHRRDPAPLKIEEGVKLSDAAYPVSVVIRRRGKDKKPRKPRMSMKKIGE